MSDPRVPPGRDAQFVAAPLASRQVAEALDAFCTRERLPADLRWRLQVAVDEIVSNLVNHAAAGATTPAFDVSFVRTDDEVEITIADDGPPFDPLARPDPDTTLPLESRKPGGLGILLVKSLMDDVSYERTGRNVLTMRKRIKGT